MNLKVIEVAKPKLIDVLMCSFNWVVLALHRKTMEISSEIKNYENDEKQ